MTTIYLVRHGAIDNPQGIIYGREDLPLSALGKRQIEILGGKMKAEGADFQVFFTSPLLRTKETVEILLRYFPDRQVRVDPRLLEVDSHGLVGRPLTFVRTIGGDLYNYHGPEQFLIEDPEAMSVRMVAVVDEARKRFAGKTVGIVSHGDPIGFCYFKLCHREKAIPSILAIHARGYFLQKGEAVRLMFHDDGTIADQTMIDSVIS